MKVKCPACSKLLQIPDRVIGKVVQCPCGKKLRISSPKPSDSGTQASSPRADDDLFNGLSEADLAPLSSARGAAFRPASQNPYATPTAPKSAKKSASFSGPVASQNKRLLNFLIDRILVVMMAVGIGMMFGVFLFVIGSDRMDQDHLATLDILFNIVLYGALFFYYAGMEAIFGMTIAKLVTGTRVVSADGGKAGFGQVLGRTFARMIPFEAVSFLVGDTTTGWHDSLSGTRVINVR